jgi:hypothetical protein
VANVEERLYGFAGKLEEELEEIALKEISGGAEQRGISQGNDGHQCTITWECSICPTHTCWC